MVPCICDKADVNNEESLTSLERAFNILLIVPSSISSIRPGLPSPASVTPQGLGDAELEALVSARPSATKPGSKEQGEEGKASRISLVGRKNEGKNTFQNLQTVGWVPRKSDS